MKSVLITGGTGSFGQAFAEHLLRTDVERVVIYSRGEHAQEQMARRFGNGRIRYFIGDVRDRKRLELAMRGIETVVHAAALKVVPIAEYNPTECISTNVSGAENVVLASIAAGVKKVIALSTDKAVNPINLYGATKLCAEKIFIAANNLSAGKPIFSVVRYGNVMGSQGSVLPLFKRIYAEGGSLPITDIRMTRFWIKMEQAIKLVMTAHIDMKGREIFIPKIPSIHITTLAEAISPQWHICGIRPGEKLHEVLIGEEEMAHAMDYDNHFVINYQKIGTGATGFVGPYASNTNASFLNEEELRVMIDDENFKNDSIQDQAHHQNTGKE